MSFFLHTGNRLETLAEQLAQQLKSSPLPPLQPEIIVVQSRGMERWLNLEIAEHNGISANIRFPFPRSFVYQAFREVVEVSSDAAFAPEVLTWKIMGALPALLDHPDFAMLKNYIAAPGTELKLYQLSEKIAGLFDQYLIYRPEVIMAWDRGEDACDERFSHSAWQAALWRAVSRGDCQGRHHAALKEHFLTGVAGLESLQQLPPRVAVFGISTLPPYYIEIFMALSQIIDFHFYYLNPCREHWEFAYGEKEIAQLMLRTVTEDDQYFESGNSLLASMGVAGREFFTLMQTINDARECESFSAPQQDSLLGCIQSDILNLKEQQHDAAAGPPQPDLSSVQIHSCHSPMREVEVLYDNLLSLFDEDAELLPKDIVVMMPDVGVYAPLIQAVFDTPEEKRLQVPYSIADRCVREENRLADVFMSLLRLDRERFSAAAVLDVIACPAVHRRCGITEQDLDIIRTWVRESGVRWGIDGSYRKHLKLPGFQEHTWRFGLDRLLLGYALPEKSDADLFAGVLPHGAVEGEEVRVLGAFTAFVERLFARTAALRRPRSPVDWSLVLTDMLDEFFSVDPDSEDMFNQLRDTLTEGGLAGFAAAAAFKDEVPLEIVEAHLGGRLNSQAATHGFIRGGVTFCTLLPMRSIPFKVVYVLGMNDGDYPRVDQRPGFDLLGLKRRLGDRSKRHEDRFLFLETLLSARQRLFISYQGRSLQDNSRMPPSVLVSELCDYIRQGWGAEALQRVVCEHPLQPFSPAYFDGSGPLFSYSAQNCLAVKQPAAAPHANRPFVEAPLPLQTAEELQQFDIEQLKLFFTNPAEYFMHHRLQARLRLNTALEPQAREPFSLDSLDGYLLREKLVEAVMAGSADALPVQAVRAAGGLPHGVWGETEYHQQRQAAVFFAERVEALIAGGSKVPRDITLALPETNAGLRAHLDHLYTTGQIFFRCAKLKARDLLRAWLFHLILNCDDRTELNRETTLICSDTERCFTPLAGEDALAEIEKMTELFVRGQREPLPFMPETSLAYTAALLKNNKAEEAVRAANKKWLTGFKSTGECEDIYVRRCLLADLPQSTDFREIAVKVYGPLLKCVK